MKVSDERREAYLAAHAAWQKKLHGVRPGRLELLGIPSAERSPFGD